MTYRNKMSNTGLGESRRNHRHNQVCQAAEIVGAFVKEGDKGVEESIDGGILPLF